MSVHSSNIGRESILPTLTHSGWLADEEISIRQEAGMLMKLFLESAYQERERTYREFYA